VRAAGVRQTVVVPGRHSRVHGHDQTVPAEGVHAIRPEHVHCQLAGQYRSAKHYGRRTVASRIVVIIVVDRRRFTTVRPRARLIKRFGRHRPLPVPTHTTPHPNGQK